MAITVDQLRTYGTEMGLGAILAEALNNKIGVQTPRSAGVRSELENVLRGLEAARSAGDIDKEVALIVRKGELVDRMAYFDREIGDAQRTLRLEGERLAGYDRLASLATVGTYSTLMEQYSGGAVKIENAKPYMKLTLAQVIEKANSGDAIAKRVLNDCGGFLKAVGEVEAAKATKLNAALAAVADGNRTRAPPAAPRGS